MPQPSHPFYPRSLELPQYNGRTWKMEEILGIFFGVLAVVIPTAYVALSQRGTASFGTKLVFLWFLACGGIHTFVEGYFSTFHATIATEHNYFAELWKEYALSDSRYMTSDPTVVTIESMTSYLLGPLCFVIAGMIYNNNPQRHLLQFAVSTAQWYGDIIYYASTLMEGAPHCDPHPFYFYFYFVFMNIWWIVVPMIVMWTSGTEIWRSLSAGAAPSKAASAKREKKNQ